MKGLKMRVPDAPLYVMYPKVVGANATPIAFAEVYLALQNKTVDAQENPLPTIEAKKFYEVQTHINLTGHITEMLLTIVSGQTWNKLSDADKKIFETVLKEAGAKATAQIEASEAKLVDEFATKYNKTVGQVRPRGLRQGLPEGAHGQLRDLGQGHLRPAAGDQVVQRRRVAPRRAAAACDPGPRRPARCRARRPRREPAMDIDAGPKVMGDDGEFHATDEAVDLSKTTDRGLDRAGASSGCSARWSSTSSSPATRSTTRPRGPRRSRATC